MKGYRTYVTLLAMGIYNVALPWLGIKDVSMDSLDIVVNTMLTLGIAAFHKVHKTKV